MSNVGFSSIRFFVCVSFIFYLLYFFFPYFYEHLYPEYVLNYLFNWPIKPLIEISNEFYYIFIAAKLIATIMVFYNFLYSKFIFLFVFLVSTISNFQIGMMVLVNYEIIIYTIINMCDGIVLYILFFGNKKNAKLNV